MDQLKFGIVGAAGRPTAFLEAFRSSGKAVLAAACDLNAEALEQALKDLPGVERYADHEEMLDRAGLDAVIVGTPMPLHVSQSIAALQRGIHVYSEVTAAVSVEECRALLKACRESKAQYMFGENCNYMKPYMLVRELVREGIFGDLCYARGEYLHDCRELLSKTPWRRQWLFESRGVTYGTHSLGPILSWMDGDRMERVCCIGAGRRTSGLDGQPIRGDDGTVMLCQTVQGRVVEVRMELAAPHPYQLGYVLQGSKAAFESRHMEDNQDENLIWEQGGDVKDHWGLLERYEKRYLPKLWRDFSGAAAGAGHGGSDVLIMMDFINALYQGRKAPIDVYAALDMTLPGLMSEESAKRGGAWVEVPDPRQWER